MRVESLIIRPSDDSEGTLDPAEREVLWDELQEVSGYSTSRYCCLRSLKDVSFPDTRSGSFDLVEEAAGTECDRIVVIDFGDTFTFVYVLSKDEAQESTGLTELDQGSSTTSSPSGDDAPGQAAPEKPPADQADEADQADQQTDEQTGREMDDESSDSDSDESSAGDVDEDADTVMMLAHITPEQLLDVIRGGKLPDANTLCIDETLPSKTLTMLPVNIDGEQFTVLITTKTERTRAGFGRGQSESVVTTGNVQRGALSASEIKSLLNQLIRKYPLDDNDERFARVPYEPHKPIICVMQQVAQATGLNSQTALKCAGHAGTMMMSTLQTTLHAPSDPMGPQVAASNSSGHVDGLVNDVLGEAIDDVAQDVAEQNVVDSATGADGADGADGAAGVAGADDDGSEEMDDLTIGKPRVVRSTSNAPHMRFEPPSRLPPPPAESIGNTNVHVAGARPRRLTVRRPLRHTTM